MIKNPRIKYCYHIEFLDDDKALLVSERENTLLSSVIYNRVLYEISNNALSVDSLISKLEQDFSIFELYYTINDLENKGYIIEASTIYSKEVSAYWNSLGIDCNQLDKVLKEKTVSIQTIKPLNSDYFLKSFHEVGLNVTDNGVIKVVITDDYEKKELQEINREAMETKQPWVLVKPVGIELWLGPIFIPGQTGCWNCLKHRLNLNRPVNTFYRIQKETDDIPQLPVVKLSISSQISSNLLALELVKWIYFGKNENLEGKLISFDAHSLSSKSHILIKRPQCKTCGDPQEKQPQPKPIILKKSSICVTSMGGYREVSSEDTLEKYQHHISSITGVVQSLKPYNRIKNTPIYNYTSGNNMAIKSKTLFWLNSHIRSANGGKGKTWSQAKVGALCEAIERYSLCYHGDEPYITGSLKGLKTDGIHPNICMNYSEKQMQNRIELNQACSQFYSMIPVPFDESLKMSWTPVYSLNEKKFKYLPSCFSYAQYSVEDETNLFSYPDSNGSAAGNSIEEAILQGFLELIERDSVAIWWYNMIQKSEVDLLSFQEPYYLQLIEYYKTLNRSLYVLDLTSDLQIPTFAAISHRLNDQKENILFGFGAHVNAHIALERSIVELNQLLPIANKPETVKSKGEYLTKDKVFVDWLNNATMKNQPYLVPQNDKLKKKASDYLQLCNNNIYETIQFCIEKVAAQGMETLILDLTRQDVGLPVVKVIVPGLRHFWRRLAPGRLYDVPVKMKWLEKPLTEEELNPIGLFI